MLLMVKYIKDRTILFLQSSFLVQSLKKSNDFLIFQFLSYRLKYIFLCLFNSDSVCQESMPTKHWQVLH
jgi:hypothetical protein